MVARIYVIHGLGMTTDSRCASEAHGFLRFHEAAERTGYPALLLTSLTCLAIAVAGVALVATVPAGWALALAVIGLFVSFGVLLGAVYELLTDDGD
jgi:uncharacterized membrane protein YidH (DUF202 family)